MFYTENKTPCYHEEVAISTIKEIISNFNPEVVIELGTKNGGFTEILQESTDDSTTIYSYDNKVYPKRPVFRDNVHFVIGDVIWVINDDIVNICKSDKKVLLYCDNGKKRKELELYTKYLKPGDMLGVHDWGVELDYHHVKDYLHGFSFVMRRELKKLNSKTRFWLRMRNGGK